MKKTILLTTTAVVFAAVAMLAAGCESEPGLAAEPTPLQTAPATVPSPGGKPPVSSSANTATTSPAPTAAPSEPAAAATAKPEKATQSLDGTPQPQSGLSAEPNPPKDVYSDQNPSLMGLKLGDTTEQVKKRFGEAKGTFAMDDSADPLTVFDYDTFSVGFHKTGKLAFVDVASADVDPGLGGVRLGQKIDAAILALGKPDVNTSHVMAYRTKTTVLKLDIDPKTKEILSIKLFARTD